MIIIIINIRLIDLGITLQHLLEDNIFIQRWIMPQDVGYPDILLFVSHVARFLSSPRF